MITSLETPAASAPSTISSTAIASDSRSRMAYSGQSSPPPLATPSFSAHNQVYTLNLTDTSWTEQLQDEFDILVRAKALRRISPEQTQKLKELQIKRSRLLNPPSVDELLGRYAKEKAEDTLIAALQAYARVQSSNH